MTEYFSAWEEDMKAHKGDGGTGASLLLRKAERAGTINTTFQLDRWWL